MELKEITPLEKKSEFILQRAEGLSYDKISKELGISKSTCSNWERELKEEINTLKSQQLNDLYERYYMTREARIKQLGTTLEKIDEALDEVDLKDVPADKLLDYKLKYMEALKDEYVDLSRFTGFDNGINGETILEAYNSLFDRVQRGIVGEKQSQREAIILTQMMRAYDVSVTDEQIEALKSIVGGRFY